jgi:ribose-phosphate pyrophosphokinase
MSYIRKQMEINSILEKRLIFKLSFVNVKMEGAVIVADPEGKGYSFADGVYQHVRERGGKDFDVQLVNLERTTFADGENKLKIKENVRGHRVYMMQDSNLGAADWISDLTLSLQVAAGASPSRLTSVLPYFRNARQERKSESRISVNAKAICDIMAMYADGALSVDLHAPQIQEYGPPRFSFDNLSTAPEVADYMVKYHSDLLDKLTLVSPDLSGGKRLEIYEGAFERRECYPQISLGHKRGDRNQQEVDEVIIIGGVRGRDCLIIDDIIDTGNTMVETQRELRKKGARSVWAYGTFGLFNKGVERMEEFDGVMVSDALDTERLDGVVEVISLRGLFGEAVYRSHVGESLSSLFE